MPGVASRSDAATPSGTDQRLSNTRSIATDGAAVTFGGNIIETGTDSYRLAHTKASKAGGKAE